MNRLLKILTALLGLLSPNRLARSEHRNGIYGAELRPPKRVQLEDPASPVSSSAAARGEQPHARTRERGSETARDHQRDRAKRRTCGSYVSRWALLGAAIATAPILFTLVSAGPAQSERIQQGNLRANLQGKVFPLTLPRHHPAPVSLRLSGGLTTTDGSPVPRVTAMRFALAGRSGIAARGLPVCPPARLRNTRTREALAACSDALVGHGRIEVQARVSGQPPFPVDAGLLVFNGRTSAGRVALLMHAHSANPPVSVVIPFVLRHPAGQFGNELVARGLASKPTISGFSMTLSRRFTHRRSRRSYLVGSCPLAPRFTSGLLTLARLEFSLQGGRRIAIETVRTCRAAPKP